MSYLTDVKGIKVGHASNKSTGVTVILPPKNTVCSVDVRGGAPGTRETDLLDPQNQVQYSNAVVLSGGSAFGLDASAGVMEYLEEHNIGIDVGVTVVPIVNQAVIFDLEFGDSKIRPDKKMGYEACKNASKIESRRGNVGAGISATIGKAIGNDFAMKSGLGSYTIKKGDLVISALSVVNAFGDIYEDGKQIAGIYDKKNKCLLNTASVFDKMIPSFGKNTTISVVATNAKFNKAECKKISSMAHNGYAMSIFPVHTLYDGDTIFTLATGEIESDVSVVGSLASIAIKYAILDAVKSAKSLNSFPSYDDIQ
ncbi:MAG: P1 family peptidase [Peptoniphilaceae bacterium]|nr:P1 family peptidase [Peptoniphilaceae bacterium]MDD7382943.1 P1 family peptidase [Peptoniphilaceae bacterium]MDY3737694.1 P1 family peptidase [Peptoniphilaceae bacterium]